MSIRFICHAFAARGVTPLGKLLMIRFADQHFDGCGEADIGDLAAFCCVDQDAIQQALIALVDSGHLTRLGANWFALAGLPPEEEKPPAYTTRSVPRSVRIVVYERDGHMCKRCGSSDDLSVDHIVPQRHGGTDDYDNLQTLCRSCNSRKGARHG